MPEYLYDNPLEELFILLGICSRCKVAIKDYEAPQEGSMTCGYYLAKAWKKYCNEGEVIVCDNCMWSDPRFIAIYGENNVHP